MYDYVLSSPIHLHASIVSPQGMHSRCVSTMARCPAQLAPGDALGAFFNGIVGGTAEHAYGFLSQWGESDVSSKHTP